MRNIFFARFFKKIDKSLQIAFHIKMRVFKRISDARLRRQMDDWPKFMVVEKWLDEGAIGDIPLGELERVLLLQVFEADCLEALVVKRVQIVQTYYAISHFHKPPADMKTNEASATSYKYSFHLKNFAFRRSQKLFPRQYRDEQLRSRNASLRGNTAVVRYAPA